MNETSEGVYLKIVLEELPILSKLTFVGNKKVKDNALLEAIELQLGHVLSDYEIFEAMQSIRNVYREKHYHNVEIDTSTAIGEIEFSKHLTILILKTKK